MRIIRFDEHHFTPASHEDVKNPGVWKNVLVKREMMREGSIQMINWSKLPIGKSFAPHYHEGLQELFIILNGKVEIQIGDVKDTLQKGDTLIVDPREIHAMKNTSEEDVEYIAIGVVDKPGGKTVIV